MYDLTKLNTDQHMLFVFPKLISLQTLLCSIFFFHYVVLIGVLRNKNILCSGNIIRTSNKGKQVFFTVSLFRTVNMPMCCEDPKTGRDVVMMETAWGLA